MTYRITPCVICILLFMAGCSGPKQTVSGKAPAQSRVVNKNPKFLDNISMTPESSGSPANEKNKTNRKTSRQSNGLPPSSGIENATPLQLKYAQLLNTEVEEIRDPRLFKFIDDWYGTRYCMGGTTKSCIDCSAFVQLFFSSLYGVNIPRTARDQYDASSKISITKLQQGDLLFYNTRGGISHVGIYLQNNKFVHASTTGGVMISDMFETYYVKHFIGAGHIEKRYDTAVK